MLALLVVLFVGISHAQEGSTTKVIRMRVTAYCPCKKCCGPLAQGICADGTPAVGRIAAADTKVLPFGTEVFVPGYGQAVVHDVGSKIRGHRLDVLFPTHKEAKRWGVQYLDVEVVE
jgi:3D (Asp-Asp-Asp) domain-containing protein